jgi:hypothetical protein
VVLRREVPVESVLREAELTRYGSDRERVVAAVAQALLREVEDLPHLRVAVELCPGPWHAGSFAVVS